MKYVKIKTWEEMLKIGTIDFGDISPPKGSSDNFNDTMEAELPTDRIIALNAAFEWVDSNMKWCIEPWMIEENVELVTPTQLSILCNELGKDKLGSMIIGLTKIHDAM